MLSSKGSLGTCIPKGVSTFLGRAFTAHVLHEIDSHVRGRCIERHVIDKAKPMDHTRGAVVSFIIGDMPGVLRCLHVLAQIGMIAFLDTQDVVQNRGRAGSQGVGHWNSGYLQ